MTCISFYWGHQLGSVYPKVLEEFATRTVAPPFWDGEMPPEMQKYKGRFCFRTPTAKDEGGALAVFQEMAS